MTQFFTAGIVGHVAHGKTTLIGSLAGAVFHSGQLIKQRCLSAETAVTPLALAEDLQLSLMDVPGHARFRKNTLRGLNAVDAGILVVAADDGVMPQTREHLRILDLLGVGAGLVVLSKTDLVDDELLALAELEVREALSGSFLAEKPIIPFSAATRQGLAEIRAALEKELRLLPAKDDQAPFRMWIDRICSFTGHGTVVCGTVGTGAVAVEDTLLLTPSGKKVRVRSLEVHRRKVGRAVAGQQVGINLPKIGRREVARGMSLIQPDGLDPVRFLNVRLRMLPGSGPPPGSHQPLRLYLGTAVTSARAVVMDSVETDTGHTFLAQLRLPAPVNAWPGDRFLVAHPCRPAILGGGRVLEASAVKFRAANAAPAMGYLKALAVGDVAAAVGGILANRWQQPVETGEIARYTGFAPGQVEAAVRRETAAKRFMAVGEKGVYRRDQFYRLQKEILVRAESILHRDQMKHTVKAAEFRTGDLRKLDKGLFQSMLTDLCCKGRLKKSGNGYTLPRHSVSLSAAQQGLAKRLVAYARRLGRSPFSAGRYCENAGNAEELKTVQRMLDYLTRKGRLIRLNDELFIGPSALEDIKARVQDVALQNRGIRLKDCQTILGYGRTKGAVVMDYLDKIGFTRKDGELRFVQTGRPPVNGGTFEQSVAKPS